MRISEDQRQAITDTAIECFGRGTRVLLFGSRADDTRRGGDIDLHVTAGDPARATLKDEIRFLSLLEGRIGEQKIDVILRVQESEARPIDDIAEETGVSL